VSPGLWLLGASEDLSMDPDQASCSCSSCSSFAHCGQLILCLPLASYLPWTSSERPLNVLPVVTRGFDRPAHVCSKQHLRLSRREARFLMFPWLPCAPFRIVVSPSRVGVCVSMPPSQSRSGLCAQGSCGRRRFPHVRCNLHGLVLL
jgi:hypothetical protein